MNLLQHQTMACRSRARGFHVAKTLFLKAPDTQPAGSSLKSLTRIVAIVVSRSYTVRQRQAGRQLFPALRRYRIQLASSPLVPIYLASRIPSRGASPASEWPAAAATRRQRGPGLQLHQHAMHAVRPAMMLPRRWVTDTFFLPRPHFDGSEPRPDLPGIRIQRTLHSILRVRTCRVAIPIRYTIPCAIARSPGLASWKSCRAPIYLTSQCKKEEGKSHW